MNLRIPGPTPMPPEVQEAAGRPMIGHRSPEFMAILKEVMDGLRWAFQTQNEVLVLTASGTGGLEAAICNLISPGDRVLAAVAGVFGERFATIAETYGAQVTRVTSEFGQPLNVAGIAEALEAPQPYHALLVTYNETSTGVLNDLASIAQIVRDLPEARRPLLLVDAISALGAADLPTDAWGCDVVISGSQKAWGAPPGLAFVSVSERAWEAMERARSPRFYFDLRRARASAEKGQTPWTPAVGIVFALQASLRLMRAEGLPAIFARHQRVAQFTREGLRRLGLELLVTDERYASPAVTAVRAPAGVDPDQLRVRLREEFQIELAGGQGPLKGKIFRIGHLGFVQEADIQPVLDALAQCL